MIAFKLILDLSYLAQLLGMRSVLVGTVASLLLTPFSTILLKRHRKERSKRAKAHSFMSNLTSEALQSLRHIRLSSVEQAWQRRLASAREQELKQMWHTGVAMAMLSLVLNLSPVLLASLSLSTHAYETGKLDSSVAFLSLNLFSSLHAAFKELPTRLTEARVSWSSYERLQRYFQESEREISAQPSDALQLRNADLHWDRPIGDSDRPMSFTLRNVNLDFPRGSLSIITGSTGSGKSLLMAGLLDEADISTGDLLRPATQSVSSDEQHAAPGSTAIVSQPPWIENCTVLDNILFGSHYNASRYGKVLQACALDKDLAVLPLGDQTVAGLNGAFLSGGQKWRVALARAFYSDAKMVILDDVLSAVDTHVASHICEQALTGGLATGRTVILVTHSPGACLLAAKYHVTVENGTASGQILDPIFDDTPKVGRQREKEETGANPDELPALAETPTLKRGKLASMSGRDVFLAYIWASGGFRPLVAGILVTLFARVVANSGSWWLARWTARGELDEADSAIAANIGIYLVLSLSSTFIVEARSLILQSMSLDASRSLFQKLFTSVLFAPISWIDSMPLGEMIQTLETDMYSMDNKTTQTIHNLLGSVIHLVFILITR